MGNYPSPYPLPPSALRRVAASIHSLRDVTPEDAARLVARMDASTQQGPGCWKWMGQKNAKGYGRVLLGNGKTSMAHRVAYIISHGDIPAHLEVGHLCHNRECVNPAHLQAMTHQENIRQRFEREGAPSAKLGRPMTAKERNRRWRERNGIKRREMKRAAEIESGWWVCI